MRAELWGVRGSLATPGRGMLGYGGNTACVHVALPDGHLVLDAGTGIRPLGAQLTRHDDGRPIHIILSHLHLDHIQGLLFFAPLFAADRQVVIHGPKDGREGLRSRLAHYLSAPLSPVELHEIPAHVEYVEHGRDRFGVCGADVITDRVLHRGLCLGVRVEHDGASLAYLPDHEPRLSGPFDGPWQRLSGARIARDADVLIHDGQYTEAQYRASVGWGHSTVTDAVHYARAMRAGQLLVFHHDPDHDDATLDAMERGARVLGNGAPGVSFAREGDVCVAAPQPAGAAEPPVAQP